MDFASYLGLAWNNHASQPQEVADGFSTGAALIKTPEEIGQMAGLITHVMGEHLGQWELGEMHLNGLRSNPCFEPGSDAGKAIARSIASLKLAAGQNEVLRTFGKSDQIRILATASSALSGKNPERARDLFAQALSLAEGGLDRHDPAARALAVTGNNLAGALEERPTRTVEETQLMISAAHAARKYWELAGTWIEVTAAEYRLAMSYIAAGQSDRAFEHAKKSVEMAARNQATGLDLFYAYEALALSERARGNLDGFKIAAAKCRECFETLAPDDRNYAAESMKKLALN